MRKSCLLLICTLFCVSCISDISDKFPKNAKCSLYINGTEARELYRPAEKLERIYYAWVLNDVFHFRFRPLQILTEDESTGLWLILSSYIDLSSFSTGERYELSSATEGPGVSAEDVYMGFSDREGSSIWNAVKIQACVGPKYSSFPPSAESGYILFNDDWKIVDGEIVSIGTIEFELSFTSDSGVRYTVTDGYARQER